MSRSVYKNKHAADHYDRIILQVPKGQKDVLKKLAAQKNLSLNKYICQFLFGTQDEFLDRMQVAAKYREMILSITGSTKDGYTVTLKDSFEYGDTGQHIFWSRTKPELRKDIKKCHVHDRF